MNRSKEHTVYFRLRNLREGAELGDQFLNRAINQEAEGVIAAQSDLGRVRFGIGEIVYWRSRKPKRIYGRYR